MELAGLGLDGCLKVNTLLLDLRVHLLELLRMVGCMLLNGLTKCMLLVLQLLNLLFQTRDLGVLAVVVIDFHARFGQLRHHCSNNPLLHVFNGTANLESGRALGGLEGRRPWIMLLQKSLLSSPLSAAATVAAEATTGGS